MGTAGPRTLDPRMRTVWTVQLGMAAAVLTIAAIVGAVVAGVNLLAPLAVAIVAAAAVAWWPRARYAHWSFALEPVTLELRHGVFWRNETSVPYFRVQHVDIEQGPIERRLGVAELRLKTAASSGGATLPGVALADAEELRRTILERAGGGDDLV